MEINNDTVKNNNVVLEKYSSSAIRRRLKRELDAMYPLYSEIIVSEESQHNLKVTVIEFINNKKQKYHFIIDNNYPFVPPKIYFQSRPYLDFLKVNYSKEAFNLFKKITRKECLCCHSFNCTDRWSPAITLKKIIDEICFFKQEKRKVINKLLADKIKNKYLIDDIDLDSWLFTPLHI
jgi:ubiquitin-protein ligase